MANISIKINMAQLKHIQREYTGKSGDKVMCLVIPIAENKMFVGEKGVYLDLTAIEVKNKTGDSKDTHLIKQNFGKEVYEAMSEDERNSYPILGNAIYWGRVEANPVKSDALSESAVDQYNDSKTEDEDSLPF